MAAKKAQSSKKKPAKKNTATTVSPKTIKQAKLVKIIESGKFESIQEAMIRAGYSESTAKKAAKRMLGKVGISDPLRLSLENVGITEGSLAQGLSESMQATRVISATVNPATPEEKAARNATGTTTDFIEVPDHKVRLDAQKFGFKLLGHPKEEVEQKHSIEGPLAERLVNAMERAFPGG